MVKNLIIQIETLGTVRAQVHRDFDDVIVARGLPFAKPPVRDLRFKAPILEDSWEGRGK